MRALLLAVVALGIGFAGGWYLWEQREEEDVPVAATWSTCTNPGHGYAVDYPAGWHTVHREPASACGSFDPRPFDVGAREFGLPSPALQVEIGDAFDEELGNWTDERDREVLQREELELDAGRAVRLEMRDRIAVELDRPASHYVYIVERDGAAVVVRTYHAQSIAYEPWKRVVDRAARSLRFTTPQQIIGADVPPRPRGVPLPEPVFDKRAEIWAAARAKDYEALEPLINDEGFEYTFGGPFPGGPTAYWRSIEQTERPLEVLAAILQLPHVYQPESRIYVWPDAFLRKPGQLTTAEKAELAEAIGENGVTAYEEIDGYLGWRAGIDADGDWVFYVAGD